MAGQKERASSLDAPPTEKKNEKEERTLALQLVDLGLAEALDERELLLARVREGLDRVHAALEQLLEVGRGDALGLLVLVLVVGRRRLVGRAGVGAS
jgi:hypothetical protein